MKTIIIALLTLISIPGFSQNKAIDGLFDRYSNREEYTKVVITKHMFSLFSNVETEADDEYMNMIKKLENIRILSGPDSPEIGRGLYEEALKAMPSGEYEEVMSIKEEGKDIKFLVREEKDIIAELVMLVKGVGESTLISITGNIDMNSVSKLTKSMGIEGMEKLDKKEDTKIK